MSSELKYSIVIAMFIVFFVGFFLPMWASILIGLATMFVVAGYQDWKKAQRKKVRR